MHYYKKFLRFHYSAIKRYGDKYWTPFEGVTEFNVNYVVSCGTCEKGHLDANHPEFVPYVLELSNGTKFLFVADISLLGIEASILTEEGETAVANGEDLVDRKFVKFLITDINYGWKATEEK